MVLIAEETSESGTDLLIELDSMYVKFELYDFV